MRLTALGKLVILILAVGIAVGVWMSWQQSTLTGAGGSRFPSWKTPEIKYQDSRNNGGNSEQDD
jgi:hypothetical protein